MTVATKPKLGVTIYSFTPVFHGRRYTFEELVAKVGELGLGPGVEVVGFQSIRGFPAVPDEFARTFRDLLDRYELEPSCLGANADAALRRDRMLTDDELADYMTAQLEAAAKLGFPTVRIQYSVTPDLIERLLPVAERLDVKMGMEIHSPHSVDHPVIVAVRERLDRLDSPYAGFIPDWGASMTQVPPHMLATYRDRGVPQELIDELDRRWHEVGERGGPVDDSSIIEEFIGVARSMGGGDAAQALAINAGGLFGHQPAEAWAEIMPHIVHVHGKFYALDENGDEPAVPHRDLLRVLVEGGYTGYISSEWEGWHWDRENDPFEVIAAQQRLERRILDEL